MALAIAQLGQPVLRQVAVEVSQEEIATPEFQRFLDDMLETLQEEKGAGLAGPQVFVGKRVFLAGIRPPQGEDERLEALRWILFDNQKVNGYLGPYRFLYFITRPAGDPAVLAFLKGRIDNSLAIVDKRLAGRQFMLGARPTIADLLAITESLRVEGDRAARRLAEQIEQACRAAV